VGAGAKQPGAEGISGARLGRAGHANPLQGRPIIGFRW
jgi:hypothetical protein